MHEVQQNAFKLVAAVLTTFLFCWAPVAIAQVAVAPAFLLKDEYGHSINIAAEKGKVVLINFWALSCIPCREELPSINQLSKHFKDSSDIMILTVSLDYNFTTANAFMYKHELTLTVYNPSGIVPDALFNGVLPTTVVINKQGNIVFKKEEQSDYGTDSFITYISQLKNK